jgi:hypothetical protein
LQAHEKASAKEKQRMKIKVEETMGLQSAAKSREKMLNRIKSNSSQKIKNF